ncbi:hypothetical protein PT276_00710 [Orbaceae bacterium ESL0721]|nr:hypothetical protein [Orbaceae bacterium ESL0721]
MFTIIIIFYYCFAILGIFFWLYFRQFIANNFYNKTLNIKRSAANIFYYFVLLISAIIIYLASELILLQKTFLLISAIIIFIMYAFFIAELENPPESKNR